MQDLAAHQTVIHGKGPAISGASFPLRNRIARAVWNMVWLVAFFPSPRLLHRWRSFLLRLFGARVGTGCHIYPGVRVWAPWNLECGDKVGIASGVILYNQAPIKVGDRAVISQGSHLCTGTHLYESPGFELVALPIEVGADSWICAEAFVMPGIKIGQGVVIGARSVVTRDVPAWTVCAGHPCKVIKPRNLSPE